ncbi:MAG: DUF1778 domain-containing protein [Microbacterium sp.]|uniref:type II toxin-antitoxin system TacA family antitoxin n=1 Tax=Microbacterium sp. TaxID=51671 RepID=UPI0039E6D1F1
MNIEIVPFRRTVDRSTFTCGKPDLDEWIQRYASQLERSDTTRTFLALDDDDTLVGYYATTACELDLDDAASAFGVGRRRYPVPAMQSIGFEVVLVDAIDHDASVFHRKLGFTPFEDDELHLFLTTKNLRLTFGSSEVSCTYAVSTSGVAGVPMEIQESGRSARLNMRISPEALELLRAAAAKQEQDLSAFVLGTAMERARAILLEDHVLRLSPHAVLQLEKALDEDARVVPQLAELVRRVRGGGGAVAVASEHQDELASR